jgi:hypothetical protein
MHFPVVDRLLNCRVQPASQAKIAAFEEHISLLPTFHIQSNPKANGQVLQTCTSVTWGMEGRARGHASSFQAEEPLARLLGMVGGCFLSGGVWLHKAAGLVHSTMLKGRRREHQGRGEYLSLLCVLAAKIPSCVCSFLPSARKATQSLVSCHVGWEGKHCNPFTSNWC